MERETGKLAKAKEEVDKRIKVASEDKYRLEKKTKDVTKRISEQGLEDMKNMVSKIVKKFDSTANRNQNDILDMLHVIEYQVSCYAEFDTHVKKITDREGVDIIQKAFGSQTTYTGIKDYYEKAIHNMKKIKRQEKKEERNEMESKR